MPDLEVRGLWLELDAILEEGFTGQIVLHCNQGQVQKYNVNEVRRPQTGPVRVQECTGSLTGGPEPT